MPPRRRQKRQTPRADFPYYLAGRQTFQEDHKLLACEHPALSPAWEAWRNGWLDAYDYYRATQGGTAPEEPGS